MASYFLLTKSPTSQIELIGTQIGSPDVLTNNSSNLLTTSQQFDNSTAWVPIGLQAPQAVLASQGSTIPVVTPDGTYSSYLLNESTSNSVHSLTQSISKAISAIQYTVYFDVLQALRTRVVVVLESGSSNGIFAVYDIAGGQVGVAPATFGAGFSGGSASIQALANGFYRCILTATSDTLPTIKAVIQGDAGSGTLAVQNTYAGTAGAGFYVAGAQLQTGSSALTYGPKPNNAQKLIDGNFTTYWDTANSQEWYGIDLGVSNTAIITGWKFAPRDGDPGTSTSVTFDYESRMVGAQIQISNDPTFVSGITTIDTVPSFPWYPRYQFNSRPVSANAASRAVRILGATGSFGSVADIRFFGKYGSTAAAKPMPPVINPWGGRFPTGFATVTITSPTSAALIYYTVDGSTPTNASTLYSGSFTLTIGASPVTLKAIAYDATLNTPSSDVVSSIFNPWGFEPVEDWYDDSGVLVEAHGGDIIYTNGWYYWCGASCNKQYIASLPDLRATIGVWLYKSKDLYNWKFVGNILPNAGQNGLVRPHIRFNPSTGMYVCWAREYGIPSGSSRMAVAQSSNIESGWSWVHTSVNVNSHSPQDCNFFVDDDGITGYLVYNGGSAALMISRLNSDWLTTDGTEVSIPNSGSREAPILFKRNGVYFLISSVLHNYGVSTTFDEKYIANSGATPLAAWVDWGVNAVSLFAVDPVGTSYQGQSTAVVNVQGKTNGLFYISDQWNGSTGVKQLYTSRSVWLPLIFADNTHVQASIPASWDWQTTF